MKGKLWILPLAVVCLGRAMPASASMMPVRHYPDPLTAADSARAVVYAKCVRENRADSAATFRVTECLGGACPDSFTALAAPGRHEVYRKGITYALLLRDPSPAAGPSVRKAFAWRQGSQFEISQEQGVAEWSPVPQDTAIYRALWNLPRQNRRKQGEILAGLLLPGTPGNPWVSGALSAHPDVWCPALESRYLDRLQGTAEEWAARELGVHPDDSTRARFREMAREDIDSQRFAVLLGGHDRTPWVRRTLLSIVKQMPDTLPELKRDWRDPLGPRVTSTWMLFDLLIDALDPGLRDERAALIHIAGGMGRESWLRCAALARLSSDTSRVVRRLIWETMEGDSSRREAGSAHDLGVVASYWTDQEFRRALHDPRIRIRSYAYGEVARRRDAAGADTLLSWLHLNRVPGGHEIPMEEVGLMIRCVGESGSPRAFENLADWANISDDNIRRAVVDAFASLGDRRAAPIIRYIARAPCGDYSYFSMHSLLNGIEAVGDASDSTMLIRWASDCQDSRDAALRALGVTAGIPTMIRAMRAIEGDSIAPERAQELESIEAYARRQLALSDRNAKP